METSKIAPLAVYLASDAAQEVTGQIFAVRANELFLMSPEPPAALGAPRRGLDARRRSPSRRCPPCARISIALDRSQDVFSWDPI